jgi:hypothetical protein
MISPPKSGQLSAGSADLRFSGPALSSAKGPRLVTTNSHEKAADREYGGLRYPRFPA